MIQNNIYVILNFPALDFRVYKIKEHEFKKKCFRCSLPYFYTYPVYHMRICAVLTPSKIYHSREFYQKKNQIYIFNENLSPNFFRIRFLNYIYIADRPMIFNSKKKHNKVCVSIYTCSIILYLAKLCRALSAEMHNNMGKFK